MNDTARKLFLVLICFGLMIALLSGCKADHGKPESPRAVGGLEVVAQQSLLAVVERDVPAGAAPNITVYFNENGRGAAYATGAGDTLRVVHNGRAGGPLQAIDRLVLSPDGKRVAYSAMINGKWRMFIDDAEGVQSDEVSAPAFSPDSRHIAYAAKIGDKWYLVLDNQKMPSGLAYFSAPYFSADSKKIVYSEKDENQTASRLVVSDLAGKRLFVKESCGSHFVINSGKTSIAAISEIGGKQRVLRLSFDQSASLKEGALFDTVSNIVFGSDDASVAYLGVTGEKRFLVVNDREDPLPDGNIPWPSVIRPDLKGAGILISSAKGYFLYQAFSQGAIAETVYDEAADLTYSNDGAGYAFAARRGSSWFIVLNGKEGAAFDRVIAPVFSPDGKLLVYRARKDGKRFVVVADADGKILRQHAVYEQVFQPLFTAGGKSVAYGVKDGNNLIWKVEKL